MSHANTGTVPGVSAGARRKGFKAELDGLRERMRGLGFGYDEIAAEVSRRYRMRPREAYRLAWGWTLDQTAARFNERAAREGTGPLARAGMTGPHLCELEKWPGSTRKPSVYVLCLLAGVYETDVLCLLDLADHESLPQQDRLVLIRRPRAETPFGERILSLLEARGLSLREAARRVPCDASHLSRVVHGRKRPSLRVAGRLDDVLEAAGELAALAEAARAAPDDGPEPRQDSGRQAGEGHAVITEGMSLTLPYVPGRLVIEVLARPVARACWRTAVMTARPRPVGSRWSVTRTPGWRWRRRRAGDGADRRGRDGAPAEHWACQRAGHCITENARPGTHQPGAGWRPRAAVGPLSSRVRCAARDTASSTNPEAPPWPPAPQ